MIQQTSFRCLSWDEANLFHSINWKMSLNDGGGEEGREMNSTQGFVNSTQGFVSTGAYDLFILVACSKLLNAP